MFRVQSLSNKIKVLSLLFLLAGLSSVSVTLWVTWQLEGGAAAVNEAGRLRMQVFRMQLSHQNHERNLLAQGNARFSASLQLLRDGDPARPLLILWTPQMRAQFERIEQDWQRLSALEERATSPEFRAQGDALGLLAGVHWVFKLHMALGMTIFLIFPFTRLVHVWSGFGTLAYVVRPYQLVRARRMNVPVGQNQPGAERGF